MNNDDGIILQMQEDGAWGIKEEPYCTVELQTREDYEELEEMLEKQIPKKPAETFTDGVFKRPYNICPVCESYVNRVYHRENCGKCSQKLDWSVEE